MTQSRPATLSRPGHSLWIFAAKREYGLILVLAFIITAVSLRNPDFLAAGSIWSILTSCTQPAIVSCGVMLVIVTGEIDISVGASLGLLTAVMGWLASPTHWNWPTWAAILAVLALGTLIGLLNGILVAIIRIPSIIVTLAMMTMLRGVTVIMMKPGDITDLPDSIRYLGIGHLFANPAKDFAGIPVSLLVTLAVIAATFALIRYTPAGRRIYAVGSNAHAAQLSGLSVTRTKILVFAITGFLVGIATLVSELATVTSGFQQAFELLVVTCVVVGGVSISGGTGTVLGVILGVLLLKIQKPVLIFLNLGAGTAYWEKAIQGALILLAVMIDHFASRKSGKSGGHT